MLAKNIHERYPSFQAILTDIRELQHSGQAFVTRAFQTGEIVCQEGDVGSFAFTILAGRVEVLKQSENGAVRLAVLGENEFVGELSVFSDEPRSATVRTIEPTVVLIMDRQAVKTELEKLSPWVERMIAGLSRRFTAQNEKLIRMESEKKG
jgi:CRP-like cAMP-binding protein